MFPYSTIIDHLYQLGIDQIEKNPDVIGVFGNTRLTKEDISHLKGAGFQDDFITKFEGHRQYVSIGVAAIWLYSTADLVAAPIIRAFLVPRSYFKAQRDFWQKIDLPFGGHLWIPRGILHHDRWDLNFGITTVTPTTKNPKDTNIEKKTYVLVGASNQLNRSALFNVGLAMVPGDIKGKERQLYLGITVDYNLLKDLGIVSK